MLRLALRRTAVPRRALGARVPGARAYTPGSLRISAERLNTSLHDSCQWGAAFRWGSDPRETGMARLTLDDADFEARRWLSAEMQALGCHETVDAMGNQFFKRKGRRDGPPIAVGSHLDTQPAAGRYDGILGIHAGLEMLRVLHENNIETQNPLALVNWTNEEGARFPRSLCGSAVWAGTAQLDDFHALRDVKRPDITLKAELLRGGFLGDVPCSHDANPLAAHFELHIEQGPILERAGKRIGVVLGGQAYSWFTITVCGQANHSGTTPLDARADAMLATARIIDRAHQLARKHSGLASTGIISAEPGSINTLPSSVVFTLDVRHASGEALARLIADIQRAAADVASEPSTQGCFIAWHTEFESPEIRFTPACIDAVREAGVRTVGADGVMDVYSGAGHDSCSTAQARAGKACPTTMVFVPSRDGITHNPREWSSPEACADGAQVILDAVLTYDARTGRA